MRLRVSTVLLLPAIAGLLAQEQPQPRPKIRAEFQPIVGLAVSAPPELAAEALLRIVDSGRLGHRDLEIEMLEQAFQFASRAQQPMRRVAMNPTPADTREIFQSQAARLGLDSLSLRCRAVKLLLSRDRGKARELFASIPKPPLEPLKCENALLYDVSDYYDLLGQIAAAAFTDQDKKRDAHIGFLEGYVASLTSPAEIGPMARVLDGLYLTGPQTAVLVNSFAAKLETISGDDRSFSEAMPDIYPAIARLAEATQSRGVSAEGLRAAFRKFLVSGLSGPRCVDTPLRNVTASGGVVDWFNTQFHGELPAISEDDVRPSRSEGQAKFEQYYLSGKAPELSETARNLRIGPDGRPLTPAQLAAPEQVNKLNELVGRIADWRPSDEQSETAYFHEKALLLSALIDATPSGTPRDNMLAADISFLAPSNLQQQSFAEWFWQVGNLWKKYRGGPEAPKVLAAFKQSGNLSLALFAMLEETLPDSPFAPLR